MPPVPGLRPSPDPPGQKTPRLSPCPPLARRNGAVGLPGIGNGLRLPGCRDSKTGRASTNWRFGMSSAAHLGPVGLAERMLRRRCFVSSQVEEVCGACVRWRATVWTLWKAACEVPNLKLVDACRFFVSQSREDGRRGAVWRLRCAVPPRGTRPCTRIRRRGRPP